ncbi:PQQ-binding-like beta-propeller repeat protein [Planctomycetota bacterium]
MKYTPYHSFPLVQLLIALPICCMICSTQNSAQPNIPQQTNKPALVKQVKNTDPITYDWPHWRGPHRNGISPETGWLGKMPEIKQVWHASIGTGFSSIAVSQGRLYTMGNTAKSRRDKNQQDVVYCLNAKTGQLIWKQAYPCELQANSYEGGPHATPTVENDRVYTCSKMAQVFCFDKARGEVIWSTDLQKDFGFKPPNWGFATSPTIIENKILLNVGSAAVALDKADGKIIWQSQKEGAGYATPLPFASGGMKGVAFIAAKHFVLIDHETGKELWRIPWETSFDISGADPVFSGDYVFISSGYNTGGALYKLSSGTGSQIWKSQTLRTQCNSSVLWQGHLYGFDGNMVGSVDRGGSLKCIEYKTGVEKWSAGGLGVGSLMLADSKIIVLSEAGELLIVGADPQGFNVLTRAQILQGKCWTMPVLSGGLIYARNAVGDLVCVDAK